MCVCVYVYILNHFAVHRKLIQHCKSTILQETKKRKTESGIQSRAFTGQRHSLFSAACHSQLQEIVPHTLSASVCMGLGEFHDIRQT